MSPDESFHPDFSQLRDCVPSEPQEYGRFQQHLVLLEDRVRLARYLAAIAAVERVGCVVDIGAGTGVLSLMALQAGFPFAYLVEPSRKIARYARYLFDHNGFRGRYELIEATLETADLDKIRDPVGLIISETMSSLIVGYGSWDHFGRILACLHPGGSIIPVRGTVYAYLTEIPLASRSENDGGIALLRSIGLEVDLSARTFRSGGNVFEKSAVAYAILCRSLEPASLVTFDFTKSATVELPTASIAIAKDSRFTGVLCYWDVELGPTLAGQTAILSSLDPRVQSWYPFYIPFAVPIEFSAGSLAKVALELLPIDAPYTYAFRLTDGTRPLTHVLYW